MFNIVPTGRIFQDVYAIRSIFVNYYVMKTSEGYIAFDSGIFTPIVAEQKLKKISVAPDEIKYLFLTHTDYDHTGGVKLFKNAKVYISKAEEQMINGKKSRLLGIKYNRLKVEYTTIEDDEEIIIGDIKIKGILTPGHTPGSMCYLVNDRYIFAGDTMLLSKGEIKHFGRLQNMDTKTQIKSLEKIEKLEGLEIICTGHGGIYLDNK
ncbi:MBL fold metallo-hydrolase [Clostridium sp. DL1XJH146]